MLFSVVWSIDRIGVRTALPPALLCCARLLVCSAALLSLSAVARARLLSMAGAAHEGGARSIRFLASSAAADRAASSAPRRRTSGTRGPASAPTLATTRASGETQTHKKEGTQHTADRDAHGNLNTVPPQLGGCATCDRVERAALRLTSVLTTIVRSALPFPQAILHSFVPLATRFRRCTASPPPILRSALSSPLAVRTQMSSVAPWVVEHGEWMDELAAHPSAVEEEEEEEDAKAEEADICSEQQQQHSRSNSGAAQGSTSPAALKSKAHRTSGTGSTWQATASSNAAIPRGGGGGGGGEKTPTSTVLVHVQPGWTRGRDTASVADFADAAAAGAAVAASSAAVAAASSSPALRAPRSSLPGQISFSQDPAVAVYEDAFLAEAAPAPTPSLYSRLPLASVLPSLPSLPQLFGRALPAAPPSPISRSGIGTTLRRLPASAHGSFSAQSDDVQLLILSMLSSVELCRMCAVSRHCNELASKERAWVARCAFLKQPELHVGVAISSFITRAPTLKGRWLRYRSWLLTRSHIEHQAAVRSLTHRRRMCVLHFLDGPFFCLFVGVCLLLGVTLTVIHVQRVHEASVRDWEDGVAEGSSASGDEAAGLSRLAMFPYLLLIAFVAFVTALMCCARWDRNRRAPSSQACCHPRAYGGTLPLPVPGAAGVAAVAVDLDASGVVRGCMHLSNADYPPQLRLTGFLLLLVLLWAVMFVLRLGTRIDGSWLWVFSPLFAVFAILLGYAWFPIQRRRHGARLRTRVQGCVTLWCILLGPLLTFSVLLAVRLSRGPVINVDPASDTGSFGLSWLAVQVPLLVMHLLLIGLAVVIALDDRSPGPVISYVVWLGPLLIFQAMLASWADQGGWDGHSPLRFTLLFIPFYLFMGVCILMNLCLCVWSSPRTVQLSLLTERTPPREPLVL